MKRSLLAVLAALFAIPLAAQSSNSPFNQDSWELTGTITSIDHESCAQVGGMCHPGQSAYVDMKMTVQATADPDTYPVGETEDFRLLDPAAIQLIGDSDLGQQVRVYNPPLDKVVNGQKCQYLLDDYIVVESSGRWFCVN